jgi:undecaprenyl pyrophosphate phosphatase UppP
MVRPAVILSALILVTLTTSYLVWQTRPPHANRIRLFLWLAAASIPTFLWGVLLHNLADAVFKADEPAFFLIAVVGAPIMFVTCLIVAAAMFVYQLVRAGGR